jgi:peptidoglycan/LPS O-acetylase OafA/YrhL
MRYLGKISYGIYVYHFAGIFIGGKAAMLAGADRPIVTCFLALVATITIAAASYRILERPFLQMKERFSLIKSRPI